MMTPERFRQRANQIRARIRTAPSFGFEHINSVLKSSRTRTASGVYKEVIVLPDVVVKTGYAVKEESQAMSSLVRHLPELRPFFPLTDFFSSGYSGEFISIQERVETTSERSSVDGIAWITLVDEFAAKLKIYDMHSQNWGFRKNTWQPVLFDIGDGDETRPRPSKRDLRKIVNQYSTEFEQLQSVEIISQELASLSGVKIARVTPIEKSATW